ncbi:hypothetical protein [Streptococcus sp. CSL10205-OR2]|uniref:hypothetical protein n=1 Tax=Streptococcus sp. CSL10205-OR2 TaxID=2980558 RepID=UPI0021D8E32A|nr:hypothetical protein [Streptococcus sp. CSL10205-OR2]MCU9533210.1 hypothetical protein [Streptococcus sp. CSL10205-OR2]
MIKKVNLLAVFNSKTETITIKKFFEQMSKSFNTVCQIDVMDLSENSLEERIDKGNYSGLLSFTKINTSLPTLLFSEKPDIFKTIYIANVSQAFSDVANVLLISNGLYLFLNGLKNNLLDYLPFNLSIYDENNQLTYTNHRPDNEFSIESKTNETIDNWIVTELSKSSSDSFSLTIPTMSSEKILIHHYQALKDINNEYKGMSQSVLDIKPILENYLNETGQAIVPWSDVTSGASIKSDEFDL